MSMSRYTCPACDGITWNSPTPAECGVCGAVEGIGGSKTVYPCDWCLMAPVPQYGDICDFCAEEESKLAAAERLCDWCMEKPARPGSFYCHGCDSDYRGSGFAMYDWWGQQEPEPAVRIPAFADEAESFPVAK